MLFNLENPQTPFELLACMKRKREVLESRALNTGSLFRVFVTFTLNEALSCITDETICVVVFFYFLFTISY